MVKLSKEESLKRVNLRKEEVKKEVSLRKELIGLKANVVLVLDKSGSMSNQYYNGTVQEIIDKIIPIAMQFDDNSEIDVYSFSDSYKALKSITLENYYGYVENNFDNSWGGTQYAGIIKHITNKYKKDTKPTYVIFITDGDNSDRSEAEEAMKEAANYPIFFQFVGIGYAYFDFLKKLDDMDGRYVDNADFFESVNYMTEDDIYSKLLNEFPQWLNNSKVKDMFNGIYGNTGEKKKGFFAKLFK